MGENDGGGQGHDTLDERVGSLEAGQQSITDKVDQILGIVGKGEHAAHDAAQRHEEEKLDRPSSVAEQIRAGLDERDARERERQAAADRDGRLGVLEQKLTDMAEKAPEVPARRVERIMGWR